ncbi:MAG TPA: protoporphyrinogen oxidase, partial [Pirellulaceae bacterium]
MPTHTSPPGSRPRIAIIGGGITGLAAAHRVTELLPNADLSLFEATERIGGVIQTVHRDGCLVEQAADSFITKTPWALDLCRRIGIADQLISTNEGNRRAFVVRSGHLLPVPDGFVLMTPRRIWPVLTSPVLSWRGKLRLLAEPLFPNGKKSLLDQSVASFATRRLGRETFERLVQPLLVGIYTADPAKLSMAATLPEILHQQRQYGSLLRAGMKQAKNVDQQPAHGEVAAVAESGARYGLFVAPKDGLSSLIEALAQQLPPGVVGLSSPVSQVTRDNNGGWLIGVCDHE